MTKPRLLMLDEPTLGIAPVLVQKIFETVAAINRAGVTIFSSSRTCAGRWRLPIGLACWKMVVSC
jgi:branched-chain amino acid transport system ATP-binding protein